ncbi:MAG TPA: DUF1552 domain-containing protein [Bryobacteraceae bacterium]|nr:DUF1552 domain-containing protein [Bryobacteraceae bacterium]
MALALPWLEAMADAAPTKGDESLSEPPLRMAFLYFENGVRPEWWNPPGDAETGWEITPHLKPLEALRDDITLVENLWHPLAQGRSPHWPKIPAWLSGSRVERTSGDDLNSNGVTLDQVLAQKIGDRTALPSLELGIDAPRTGIDTAGGGFARMYGSCLSWSDPRTPVVKEIVPQLAFDRVYRGIRKPVVSGLNANDPSILESLQGDDTSVLDLVADDAKKLRRAGSSDDNVRLDEYFDSVRSVEKRMVAATKPHKRWINQGKFPLERPSPGIPASHAEHVKLMLDIMILALWSDTTRIASFMFGDAQTNQDYAFLTGHTGGFHSISHHGDSQTKIDQYGQIVTWHITQMAYFLDRIKKLDEGGKSLLDNSMILMGNSLKDGNLHREQDLPLIVAGRGKGSLRPGRRIKAAPLTPMCNLHLAFLNRMGIPDKSFNDSTEPLKGLS